LLNFLAQGFTKILGLWGKRKKGVRERGADPKWETTKRCLKNAKEWIEEKKRRRET